MLKYCFYVTFLDNEVDEESEEDDDYIPSEDWKKVNTFIIIFFLMDFVYNLP